MAGADECACCVNSRKVREEGTGLCKGPDACACCGQPATSGAQDKRVLLEAKAAADTSACAGEYSLDGEYVGSGNGPCPVDSWTPDTEPCGNGVTCDARGGRVASVNLVKTGVGGELLPFFGRLGALVRLRLSSNPALRGDVADLAGATELRALDLNGCPLVVGEAAALAALVHLGGGGRTTGARGLQSPYVP
eukprot:COSAG04_NODE_3565_length_2706_cov_4.255082_3_plen_192_part_01